MPGILDIVNSIAVFQLLFFAIYLFIKGNRIPSTFYLKIHLISQLISFITYFYFRYPYEFLVPFLTVGFPVIFLWAPTLYLYIRSRLFVGFIPAKKQLIHGLPALILLVAVIIVMQANGDHLENMGRLGRSTFPFLKLQLLVYPVYCLFLIYRYLRDIQYVTSANEKKKLNWLLFFTYGITFTSLGDIVLNIFPETRFAGVAYLLFWVFINIFFFKAIIDPDQFLGIEEKKLLPLQLSMEKGLEYFSIIENTIASNQLYLDPDLSLSNVAQAVGLSDRLVSQSIKQNVHLNFSDYINLKRIAYAKDLLQRTTSSEKNILEILYDSGFNSKSVFNSQFKKHTGQSPTEYRRQINRQV
jgi:AraC-like DNA-binding protein